ncbi:MAG: tetratricopeptide repeat protein [Kiritimatiellaeota bacterium]|nr:tetratricopeptide repeat protein [Kiritimatiellota bacterium]
MNFIRNLALISTVAVTLSSPLVVFTAFGDTPSVKPGGTAGNPSESRYLGDKAFKDGIYDLAVKFYLKYKAESAGNTEASIDASECLIATYVRSGNPLKAREEFTFLTTKFAATIAKKPDLRRRLSYWDACVLLASGDLRKASESFKKLLKALPRRGELYYRTLDALGTTYARWSQWVDAEKTFALLAFTAKNTHWEADAEAKRVLAVVMMGDYKEARLLISQSKIKGDMRPRVMRGLMLAKEGLSDKALVHYKTIRKHASGPDPLWYLLATSLAESFKKKGDVKTALWLLNDALLFASSEFDRQKALVGCINCATATGNITAARAAAEKFLKNYPDSFISNEIRLRLAGLYAKTGSSDDALQVLTTIIKDPAAELDVKVKSAREAARIYLSLKRYDDADEMFAYMEKNGADEKTRGEGSFWRCETLLARGEPRKAAVAFDAVAAKFADWKEKALYAEIKILMSLRDSKTLTMKMKQFLRELPRSSLASEIEFLYAIALKNAGKLKEAGKRLAEFARKRPEDKYAPRALFESGLISLDNENCAAAVTEFDLFCRKYPNNPLIPNVRYRLAYALFAENRPAAAIKNVETLAKRRPGSKYTVHALFRLAAHHQGRGEDDQAVAAYRKAESLAAAASFKSLAARAVYEIADIYFKKNSDKKALRILDELSEKYSKERVEAYGLFLRGDIFSKNSEYEKAIPFYKKAVETLPSSLLEKSSWGRIGDCYFALGWKTPDGTNYLTAIKFYQKVFDSGNLPSAFLDQVLYKIGRSEELLGDKGKALLKYREVMYRYDLDKELERVTARSSVWFAKSAIAAARLYLAKETPEAAEAAMTVYGSLVKAGLEPRDDLKKKIEQIQVKYKLKE